MSSTIVGIVDFQDKASKVMKEDIYGYFMSGSDDEVTLRNNILAFEHIFLAPRVLVDMANFDMKIKILGREVSYPFGFEPVAMQKLVHEKGELLSATEAYNQGTAYGLSMMSSTKIKEVATVNPSGLKILQIYFLKNQNYTL
jgi:isopentenyl diphosphate isomerase/L-lactate dehydrogenase-like FMN-dependent dehydrogenase